MSINSPTTRFPKTWRAISNARKSVSAFLGYKKAAAPQQDVFTPQQQGANRTEQPSDGMSDTLRRQLNPNSLLLQQSRRTPAQPSEEDYLALPEVPTHDVTSQGGLTGASLPKKEKDIDAEVARMLQEAEDAGNSDVIGDFAEGLRSMAVEQEEATKALKSTVKALKGQPDGKALAKTAQKAVTFAEGSIGMNASQILERAKTRLVLHNAKLAQQMQVEAQNKETADKQRLTAMRQAIIKNQAMLETLQEQEELCKKSQKEDAFGQSAIRTVILRFEKKVIERIAEQKRFLPKEQDQ